MTGSSKSLNWLTTVLLTLSVAVVINVFLLDELKPQWDLTEDDRYTLPEAAKSIAAKLEDVCTIKCYLSDPLPSYLGHVPRGLRTRLEEFRAASGEQIAFEFIAPEKLTEDERKLLAERQISPTTLPDQEGGRKITGAYYVWLEFEYGDQEQTLNLLQLGQDVVQEAEFLRRMPYEIAQKLVKLQNPDAGIGIVSEKKLAPPQLQQTGMFPKEASDSLASLRNGIEASLAAPTDVDLSTGGPVGDDVDALIVYRPESLSEREVFEIDQALMKGKNVAILLDNYATVEVDRFMSDYQPQLQQGRLKVRPLDHGLTEWLAHFGVEVEGGHVESLQSATAVLNRIQLTPNGLVPVSETRVYPAAILLREKDKDGERTGEFSDGNPAYGGLTTASMFAPVPMTLDSNMAAEHLKGDAEVVLQTSADSYTRTLEGGILSLYSKEAEEIPSERQAFALAISLRGEFTSYFAGKSFGPDNDQDRPPRKGPTGGDMPPAPNEEPKLSESIAPAQLWVFADADFCSDLYLAQRIGLAQATQSQQAWASARQPTARLLNVVNGMTAGMELVEIRKPSLTDRSLDAAEIDEDRDTIRRMAVGLAPLLVVAFGILWGLIRWLVT